MQQTVNKRFIIKMIERNDLLMDEELEIFQVIFNKYNFKTISEYAKSTEKTYQGVEYQVLNGLVQNIEVGSIRLLFE